MIAACVFIVALAGYIFSMAPGIVVGDCGEFCAAAATLALPHSPGYPLFCLIGKIVTIIVPLASIAYRINLLSAVSGAATVTVLYRIFRKLIESGDSTGFCAAASALAVGASAVFMSSAVQAEVFTLNSLFAVLVVWSVIKGNIWLASFIFGLGLGNHHTLIFVLPFVFAELFRAKRFSLRDLFACMAAAGVGCSVYVFLLIRSHAHPPLNWGDPENLHNLWRVVSRADYGSLSLTVGEKVPVTFSIILRQLQRYIYVFSRQFTVAGAVLGCVGWIWALKKRLARAKELLITWLLIGPCFLIFANLPFNGESGAILERFYILPNIFFAFGIFYGMEMVRNIFGRRFVVSVISLCAVLFLFAIRVGATPWRWNLTCNDYGHNILRSLPLNSILFIDGGDDTFYSLAYFTFAQRLRPDIEVHDRGGLVFKNIYGPDFRSLSRDEKEARRQAVEKAFLRLRPVFFSTFNPYIMPDRAMSLNGMLYAPAMQNTCDSWPCYNMRAVYGVEYPDYRTRALIPVYTYFEARRNPAVVDSAVSVMMCKWPDVLWVPLNSKAFINEAAYNEINAGNILRGKELLEKAAGMFSDDSYALATLGVLAEKQNDLAGAERYNKLAISVDPKYADAYYNLMVLFWKKQDWKNAQSALEQLQRVAPSDSRAAKYLPIIRSKLK